MAVLDASVQSRSFASGLGCDKCNVSARALRDLSKASRVSVVQNNLPSLPFIDEANSNNGACN